MPWSVAWLVLLVGGLNAIDYYSNQWSNVIGLSGASTLSLTGYGTLSWWFCSALLLMSAFASLQIYLLRKHRCDDYRGTYRIWLWMSVVMVVSSACFVINFGAIAQSVIENLGYSQTADGQWILLAATLVALALLIIPVLFEIRVSRGSLTLLVGVWALLASAAVIQVPSVAERVPSNHKAIAGNLLLFSVVGIFITHLVYARFVFLAAQGFIKPRQARKAIEDFQKRSVKGSGPMILPGSQPGRQRFPVPTRTS